MTFHAGVKNPRAAPGDRAQLVLPATSKIPARPCSACQGTGRVQVPAEPADWRRYAYGAPCPICEGLGRIHEDVLLPAALNLATAWRPHPGAADRAPTPAPRRFVYAGGVGTDVTVWHRGRRLAPEAYLLHPDGWVEILDVAASPSPGYYEPPSCPPPALP